MLLFVNLHLLSSRLNYHPDREDVLLINGGGKTKPLYWIFGLSEHEDIERKIREESLGASDFTALVFPFNDPNMSFFTVNAGAPHYEVTAPGPGRSPSFWVTEPFDLPMVVIDLKSFKIDLAIR